MTTPTWEPIESAPRGGFPRGSSSKYTTDPDWTEPPVVLLWLDGHGPCAARWDWYYATGGNGFNGRTAWVEPLSGEQVDSHGTPTHWLPLPEPPQ